MSERMVKEKLKKVLGPAWRERVHRLSRLRWIAKWHLLHRHGVRLRERPLRHLAYVLFDPEVESWTYELANEDEVVASVAAALDRPVSEIATYAAEARADPELHERLRQRTKWRFDVKHRQPLGNRLVWYLLVRAHKPQLVIETGIYHGLGSLVLLRALERNANDGVSGELMSFDLSPRSGTLVDPRLRTRWQRIIGVTTETIGPALEGRRVGALFQDTPHTEENQLAEFGAAIAHAEDRLLLVDGSGGWAPTLERLCERYATRYHFVDIVPRDHFVPGTGVGFAIVNRGARAHP